MFPDYIIVNDDMALRQAEECGLPKKKLVALGNPLLEKMSKIKFNQKNKKNLKKNYNLPTNKRLIFFISEELKNHFNKNKETYLGYDEFVAIEHIKLSILSDDHIVIKLHPEERKSKFSKIINSNISILKDCPINDIISIADIIIGMDSMLLLELSMHKNNVISYRPNAKKKFIGDELGVTFNINDLKILKKFLKNNFKINNKKFNKYFDCSKEKIIKFIKKVSL